MLCGKAQRSLGQRSAAATVIRIGSRLPFGSGSVLVGMALALTNGDEVTLEFLEGDPAPDCPLKGFSNPYCARCSY